MIRSLRVIILLASLLMLLATLPIQVSSSTHAYTGPWIDTVHASLIEEEAARVEALLDDDIDMIGSMLDPTYLSELEDANSIAITETPRNGYCCMSINTQKYPFNITAFRRAFAFALNKSAIAEIAWQGLADPLDSCVPRMNPYSIEGDLPYSYYDANYSRANELLDAAGFVDVDEDGWREAPDGSPFDVLIEFSYIIPAAAQVAAYAVDALTEINIEASCLTTDWYDYLCRLHWLGDYDVVLMTRSFSNMDVDWMGYDFWGEKAYVPGWNPTRFVNASFDAWRDQLLRSIDPDEVEDAAREMQKIWVYECPEVVCYQNSIHSAYRTDRFEGFVEDVTCGIPGWWTYYKTQLRPASGGPFGGTLRTTMSYDVQTFNFMMMPTEYPLQGMLYMMYDSLFKVGPDGIDIPWLAESYLVETHADNSSVPDGHTQVTFEIRQNITWSDGTPLTADDVSYSINYYRETGGPYGPDLWNMTQVVMMTPYKVRFHFDTESIWHLHAIVYKPILPKHIFVPQVGYDGWNEWNPLLGDTTLVSSGPFLLENYVNGSYVTFSCNPNYFFGSNEGPDPTDTVLPIPIEPILLATGITAGTIVIFVISKRR